MWVIKLRKYIEFSSAGMVPQVRPPIDVYSTLVFSGGGAACASSYSCACALRGKIPGVNTVVGTSGGAIVASLYAMRANERRAREVFGAIIETPAPSGPRRSPRGAFGLLDSEAHIAPVVSRMFEEFYGSAEARARVRGGGARPTFSEFRRVTGSSLLVSAFSVSRKETVLFGPDSHPDLDVVRAIVASCAYPVLTTPVYINGELYADSSLAERVPVRGIAPGEKALIIDAGSNSGPEVDGDAIRIGATSGSLHARLICRRLRSGDVERLYDAGSAAALEWLGRIA